MANRLVPYKFEVVATCHVLDEGGKVVAEQPLGRLAPEGQLLPVTVFAVDGLVTWAEGFTEQLDAINARSANGDAG